jgi:hypothetical protein
MQQRQEHENVNVKWVSFKDRSGPLVHGVFDLSTIKVNVVDDADHWLRATVAVEGGHFDCVNMYDRGIVSVGLLQWIEAGQYGVAKLLSRCCEQGHEAFVLERLSPVLTLSGAKFVKTPSGWRFSVGGSHALTLQNQSQLFLGCDGKKTSWTPALKKKAEAWAAALAGLWELEDMRAIHYSHAKIDLTNFFFKNAKQTFSQVDTPEARATKCLYAVMAVNMPGYTDNLLGKINMSSKHRKLTPEWCGEVTRAMATSSSYPNFKTRFEKSRDYIERAFGVELPDPGSKNPVKIRVPIIAGNKR